MTSISILLVLLILGSVCGADAPPAGQAAAGQPPVSVAPGDPGLRYIGRWDKSDPATFHSYWGGAYVRADFTGTSVGVKLASPQSLVAAVDGREPTAFYAQPGMTLFSKLGAGRHSLLVGAAGQNEEVSFQGLVLDAGGATVPPPPARPLIEFIGDSITTGTGPPSISTVNWAWNTAEALGCDHAQIAFSGVALTNTFGCSTKVGMDVQYFRLKNFNHTGDNPPVPWDFSYTPRVVVINLGQNDQCGGEPDATMTASYVRFVQGLRAKFPAAQIVALRPFGGPYEKAIRAAMHSLIAAGDARVRYVDTTGWLTGADYGDGVHPNASGNLKILGELVPLLRPLVAAR